MSERQIVKMVFGSHVYGTNTPNSDKDFKAVFIPSADDILMQRAVKTSRNQSTGPANAKNAPGDVDIEEFSLHGYLKLLCEGQTVAVDMLFVPNEFIMNENPVWWQIRGNREHFISKAIKPFIGYCRQQANKYGIKGSRMAAAKDAAECLRAYWNSYQGVSPKLGDAVSVMEGLHYRHPEHIDFDNKIHPANGATVRHFSVCGRLAPFTLRMDRAAEMYERLWQDYGDRSRQAMNNEGIDWKALMHARRICDQAVELLGTGKITFPRPNADELLKIRLGERPYAEVAHEIELGMEYLEIAMMQSQLRETPNKELAEAIILDEYARQVKETR